MNYYTINNPKRLRLDELLLILALALKPLYLGASGGIQLSDICFALLFFAVYLQKMRLTASYRIRKWLLLFLGVLLYQTLISLVWQMITDDLLYPGNLLSFLVYYAFNFMVVCAVIQLNNIVGFERLLRDYAIGLGLSCLVCLLGMLINPAAGIRQMGFFNNPNQLGYYCVIIYTSVLIFSKYFGRPLKIFVIVCACVFTVLSMSKAAIVSIGLLLFVMGFLYQDNKLTLKGLIIRIVMLAAFALLVYAVLYSDWDFFANNRTISTMRYRMMTMLTENDSDLGSGRGYDRIKEIGMNIIFGVGEGKFGRFSTMTGYETHSSYASLLVSYGIIGFLSYVVIFYMALKRNVQKPRHFIMFIGIFFYCITHNGIRNTLLWSLLAAMMLWQEYSEDNRKHKEQYHRKPILPHN